ncbi:hypothetical protein [Hymenobacter coccineus]|nr:hypothetical protein [Hymenobacter coccineus]
MPARARYRSCTTPIGPRPGLRPVPAGYVLALERLRFTLNLRRFFVAV